jgi:hypothetical protein
MKAVSAVCLSGRYNKGESTYQAANGQVFGGNLTKMADFLRDNYYLMFAFET